MKNKKNENLNGRGLFIRVAAVMCCMVLLLAVSCGREEDHAPGGERVNAFVPLGSRGESDCIDNPHMELDYKVTISPDPLVVGGEGASIIIKATYPGAGTPVTISAVTIEIRPGGEATALTTQPGGIVPVAPGTAWTIDKSHATGGIFVFQGTGEGIQAGGEGLTFTLSGITVNDRPGPTPVKIHEYTSETNYKTTCTYIHKTQEGGETHDD